MRMQKKTIRDVDLRGKRVLMRVDFNVPLEAGRVTDDTRIVAALPTIRAILEQHPRAVILMSHLGRPKGEPKPEFSLRPVAGALAELLGQNVAFTEDCVGEPAERALAALPEGGVLLLENTRFHKEETENDPAFSAQLAKLGDIFVEDAFGSVHRAHASTVGVTEHLPSVAGLLLEREIEYLSNALENPKRPFVAILGGAKVSDKIAVIENLLVKADKILIGGGMANTFLKAQGIAVGDSLVEDEALDTARNLLAQGGDKLILPGDVTIADAFDPTAVADTIKVMDGVPPGWRIMDIGVATVQNYGVELQDAKTIVWNGPMGVFEFPRFAQGTQALAAIIAGLCASGTIAIIGGGDSAAAVQQAGVADKVTHISTGGGASLELLEGKELPGLAALDDL
jgi:phosphoglycerate kinase